jgi:iron complex outermembrane recepter protein
MKKIFIVHVFLWIAGNTIAQNSLSGVVRLREQLTAVNGATIYIPDLKTATNTDSIGKYAFEKLPKGKFLVECKKTGFSTMVLYIEINGATNADFLIEEEVVEIHEITVTGTTQSTDLHENPVAITTMNNEELFQNAAKNLIDNISKKAGVNQLGTGAAISKPVIRGLGYNRVVVLNNGIRQEGQQWGDEHGIEIDEYSVDRVEIIKGPGSLMYGSDAIGGVINFLAPNPLPEGTKKLTLLSNYQTNNHLRGGSIFFVGNKKGVNYGFRVTGKDAGNYRNKYDGYVYNSGFKERDGNAYTGIAKRWGYTYVYYSGFTQTIAMPEGERDSLGRFVMEEKVNDTLTNIRPLTNEELKGYAYHIPQQTITHDRVSNSTKFFFGKSNLSINAAYQNNARREFGNVFDPETPDLDFSLRTFNYDIRFQFPEWKGWNTTLGVNGMQQSNKNKGIEALIPNYSLFDIGGYVFAKKQIKKLNIAGGIRFDDRLVNTKAMYIDSLEVLSDVQTGNNYEKFSKSNSSYSAISGSAGFAYEFSEKLSLKLNLARGFRAPNISEISSNGKHEGSLRYEIGNAKLKPETSAQIDLGIDLHTDHLSTELAVFYNSIQNYIYSKKLVGSNGGDSIVDMNDPAPVFQFTQGNAFLYGGEYSIDIHPHPVHWLHIENAISMVIGQQKNQPDSMTYLPFIPATRYQGELRCEMEKVGKYMRELFFSAGVNYYFEQGKIYSAYDTERASEAYTLVNAGLGFILVNKKGNTLFNFVFCVNNVLDVAYQNHLSRLQYAAKNELTGRTGIYNMGRNFSFKIFIPIEFRR